MTDLIKTALIAAMPPTIAAIGSFIATLRTHGKVVKVESEMNGMKDALIKKTQSAAFAEGVKSEQDKTR